MKIDKLYEKVNYADPFAYAVDIIMASNNGAAQSSTIQMGNLPLYVADVSVSGVDSLGKVICEDNNNPVDVHSIQVVDANNKNWFAKPISLLNFKTYFNNINNRGYVFDSKQSYTITITSNNFPQTPVLTYPVRYNIVFSGLNKSEDSSTEG